MPVTGAFVLPHPPVILPEVGHGREREIQKNINAYREAAARIAALKPEVIVLSSPHSVMYADYFHISPGAGAEGGLERFGARGARVQARYDTAFVDDLCALSIARGIPAGAEGEREAALDHGTLIPLRFINALYTDYKLVRTGLSGLSTADHYRYGQCIAEAAAARGSVVFIASGDLSHKVAAHGPYGFAPEGERFDSIIADALADGDFQRIMSIEPELAEQAAECGLRSILIMAGALDGMAVEAELLSYEGTLGVGYGVASFIPRGLDDSRHFLSAYEAAERARLEAVRAGEDAYVRLARHSINTYIREGKRAALPGGLPADMLERRAGVFVSIKKHGALRGCIGTIGPVTDSVALEILRNAVSAAAEDPRFDPITTDELDELVVSVDVLSPPEPIDSEDMLDVKRYGVIVTAGRKRGLLLPNLEGVDTVAEQVAIAKRKAGIRDGERCALERFEVVRHV